jgi:cytochrome c6
MTMRLNKTRNSIVRTSAILAALAVAVLALPGSILRAGGAPDSAASATLFRSKCAMCHGADGAGSEVGKSLNIPDLRSQAVQKLPNAELIEIISNGKGGMPSFKNSLSPDQIHALVMHVRSLGRKK